MAIVRRKRSHEPNAEFVHPQRDSQQEISMLKQQLEAMQAGLAAMQQQQMAIKTAQKAEELAKTMDSRAKKARKIGPRALLFGEKILLRENIAKLPGQQLGIVLQIIAQHMPISTNNDDIEIDLDSLDTVTLRELQQYVKKFFETDRKNRIKRDGLEKHRLERAKEEQKKTEQLIKQIEQQLGSNGSGAVEAEISDGGWTDSEDEE